MKASGWRQWVLLVLDIVFGRIRRYIAEKTKTELTEEDE